MGFLAIDREALKVGLPVAFDIYDDTGHLLARSGHVITGDAQLNLLCERGRHLVSADLSTPAAERPIDPTFFRASAQRKFNQVTLTDKFQPFRPVRRRARRQPTPIFNLLADAEGRLAALLCISSHKNFVAQVREIAGTIAEAYRMDQDAALAQVLLQHGADYAIYHHVHTALVANAILDQSPVPVSDGGRITVISAALTMNIAMLALQEEMWASPHRPTPAQLAIIRAHPSAAVEQLRSLGVDESGWLTIVGEHHESMDGSGYPRHLKGAEVSRAAQVVSVADRYGTMVAGRAYREPMLAKKVLGDIFLNQKEYDHGIASLLIKALGVYPPGSLVELENHEIAMVTRRTEHAHQPLARTILTSSGRQPRYPVERRTGQEPYRIVAAVPMSKVSFTIDARSLWDQVPSLQAA